MLDEARGRAGKFRDDLAAAGVDLALITDESSIAYLAGFWGYLSVEFGRPIFLLVGTGIEPIVITPGLESEMASAMTWVDDVRSWNDDGDDTWPAVLGRALGPGPAKVGIEADTIPAMVRNFLDENFEDSTLVDVGPVLGRMRTIKSAAEIDVMRQAGRVGAAMMAAAEGALGEGIPEYEAALAVIDAGTRAAAGFLTDKGWEAFISPMIHNLQVMQSGRHASMVHRRAGVRRMQAGDPVYFCFCNMLEFKHYRLGFDRMFHIGHVTAESERAHRCAIEAQRTALDQIRAGAVAEDVAHAANTVYEAAGFAPGYRHGRSIGVAYLERPELKIGDKTVLKPGMTFAVDGGVSIPGVTGGRIGDSIVVTGDGFDYLTEYPRDIRVVPR